MDPSLLIGLRALRANPLRTALSTLGVIIGVGALVAVLSVGDGVERFARREIERSTDLQIVTVAPRTTRLLNGVQVRMTDYPLFTIGDADALEAVLGGSAAVQLEIVVGVVARVRGDSTFRGAVVAGIAAPPRDSRYTVTAGRWLDVSEMASAAPVTVLPRSLAHTLGLVLGDSVLLGPAAFRVVGLLTAPDGTPVPTLVPLATVARALAPLPAPPPSLTVHARTIEKVPVVRERVEDWLAARWNNWKDHVVVRSNQMRVDQARRALLVFKLLMGAITGISLVVGGIGIMNVLLASVTERTREIGVRRAAGARRRDILIQFLAESVALTGAGAALGVVVGLAVGAGVSAAMRAQAEAPVRIALTWPTLAVAAGAGIVVGLAFGTYPALRAARLSPIDAIRHE